MTRCPCCAARLNGATCHRCQANLSAVHAAERAARYWLAMALRYGMAGEHEHGIVALEKSLQLHPTPLAYAWRGFLIDSQCREIIRCLAQRQLFAAKQRLYPLRRFYPYSPLLRQLNQFCDFLLTRSPLPEAPFPETEPFVSCTPSIPPAYCAN